MAFSICMAYACNTMNLYILVCKYYWTNWQYHCSAECRDYFGRSLFILGQIQGNDYFIMPSSLSVERMMSYSSAIIQTIARTIKELIGQGAKTVVVAGNIPIGFTSKPLVVCCGTSHEFNWPGREYNWDLLRQCGTPNVTACQNPSTYVNWDGLCFTEATNRYVANSWLKGPYADPPILDAHTN
ncbi:GDSL esterase/lipase [Rhynchospora pubera]|uniref:GDSL esterase/lipase n=1 Tax=Rhynchospora pubera TaxID=906938 RepID=A0AAV8DFL9_9POAL|nr:GDSL esterase/lipase [Rhynchospora pubera]